MNEGFGIWRAGIVIALMGMAFTGGTIIASHGERMASLEAWQIADSAATERDDARIRALEAELREDRARFMAQLEAIRNSLHRIEGQIGPKP